MTNWKNDYYLSTRSWSAPRRLSRKKTNRLLRLLKWLQLGRNRNPPLSIKANHLLKLNCNSIIRANSMMIKLDNLLIWMCTSQLLSSIIRSLAISNNPYLRHKCIQIVTIPLRAIPLLQIRIVLQLLTLRNICKNNSNKCRRVNPQAQGSHPSTCKLTTKVNLSLVSNKLWHNPTHSTVRSSRREKLNLIKAFWSRTKIHLKFKTVGKHNSRHLQRWCLTRAARIQPQLSTNSRN